VIAIGTWLRIAAAAGVATTLFTAGWTVNGWRMSRYTQAMQIEHQNRMAALQAKAIEMQSNYRAAEQAARFAVDAAKATHALEISTVDRLARAAAADAQRVRGQLSSALAARGGGTAEDALAACHNRAAAAGRLLEDGMRLQGDLAGDAERLAADVRALRSYADTVATKE
jgi:hypothetical protein